MKEDYMDEPTASNEGNLSPSLGYYLGNKLTHGGRKIDMLILVTTIIYGIAFVGWMIWTFTGTRVSNSSEWVLRTGRSIPVDQFRSASALSAIFTPLAIILRHAASRLSRIHLFMVAREKRIPGADVDRMSYGGIVGAIVMSRYSPAKGILQLILMFVGAILVPVATLSITTGDSKILVQNSAMIGIPTSHGTGGQMNLSAAIIASSGAINLAPYSFQEEVSDIYKGNLLSSAGILLGSAFNNPLSSQQTEGLTPLMDETWYDGVLTYNWSAACEAAPEITYNVGNGQGLITSPNGTSPSFELSAQNSSPVLLVWNDGLINATTETNAVTYLVAAGNSSKLTGDSRSGAGLTVGPDVWISAVKCKASLVYEASRCQWSDATERMTKCSPLPNETPIELDTIGLKELNDVFNAMPLALYLRDDTLFQQSVLLTTLTYSNVTGHYRGPRISDYVNMYGLIARSMVEDVTNGFYGTATIPTEYEQSIGENGSVYLVRIPGLLIVTTLVFTCILALGYDIGVGNFRKSAILEMGTDTARRGRSTVRRGRWWDGYLDWLCAAPIGE